MSSQHSRTVKSALSQRARSQNTFNVTESNGFKIVTLHTESQTESMAKKSINCDKSEIEKLTKGSQTEIQQTVEEEKKEQIKVETAMDLRAQYFAERAKKRSSLSILEGWGGSLQE